MIEAGKKRLKDPNTTFEPPKFVPKKLSQSSDSGNDPENPVKGEPQDLADSGEMREFGQYSSFEGLQVKTDEAGNLTVGVKKKNKRGRPEKVIHFTDQELVEILKENICTQAKDICSDNQYDFRADTLRVRLMRLAKKIPLFLLHKLHSKSKYKSTDVQHFKTSFLQTFLRFFRVLKVLGIEPNRKDEEGDERAEYPAEFVQFCTLHFPRSKCEQLFRDSKDGDVMAQLLAQRTKTSLKSFLEFGKANRVFHSCIKLTYYLGKDVFNDKAKSIIKHFIKVERETYPNCYYPQEIEEFSRE